MDELERLAQQVAMLWTFQMIVGIDKIDFETPIMQKALALSVDDFNIFSAELKEKLASMGEEH